MPEEMHGGRVSEGQRGWFHGDGDRNGGGHGRSGLVGAFVADLDAVCDFAHAGAGYVAQGLHDRVMVFFSSRLVECVRRRDDDALAIEARDERILEPCQKFARVSVSSSSPGRRATVR